jgi:hypothetical protein
MVVVRNIFQLKFGQARDAVAAWKEGLAIAEKAGMKRGSARLLTDLAGPDFYTLVLEVTYDSLAEFEQQSQKMMSDSAWRTWYPKVAGFAEGGRREILSIVE